MHPKYDVAVLGGGPGGYTAAIRAAQLGASVVLIEKDTLGGTCLNTGCIPSKAIIACISLYNQMQKSQSFGISAQNILIDPQKIVERKNKIIEKLVKGVEFLLEKNKVEILRGKGTVLSSDIIEILNSDGRKLSVVSRKLILATGSSPISLPNMPFDGKQFLSSDDILNLKTVPEKLDIVGGGVIGIQFAYIFSSLGSEVTIYEAMPDILKGVDPEAVTLLKRILARKNITIKTNTRFSKNDSCGTTLICVGRKPNLESISELGLKMSGSLIATNEKMETSIKDIYAIGDIASKKMLAHVASEQGIIAAENAMGLERVFSYDFVPYTIYTDPEIAGVGAIEGPKVGKFPYSALGISQAMGDIEGFIKVISDELGKILGVHIIGPGANTLIGAATLAIKNNLTVTQLAETIQAHPSYPEGLQEAALSVLKRSIHIIN